MFISKLRFFLIIITFSVVFQNCKNDNNYIPYAYVNFYVYLGDPEFYELNAIGNSVFYNYEGYKGIIIYRKSTDEFQIFDQCCSYEPTASCEIVEETDEEYIVKCNCCGSVFSLYDGYPIDGPAKLPLKSYNYTFDGFNDLHIYN